MKSSCKALAFAAILTAIHFAAKLAGGYLTNSLALFSDAWHLLTDLLSLLLSWWALRVSTRPPTCWATYGFHRVGTLAALINNVSLIGISFYILYEAYLRYMHPEPLEPMGMLGLAAGGILASAVIAWLVHDGARTNLNMRSVWLHFASEALASLDILLGGVLIYFTAWYWVDALLSASLAVAILRGALVMLRDIALILLEGTPRSVSVEEIAATLVDLPVITAARDIHVWCLSEEKLALSAHVQLTRDVKVSQTEEVLQDIKQVMAERYNITHINVQFELRECGDCRHG